MVHLFDIFIVESGSIDPWRSGQLKQGEEILLEFSFFAVRYRYFVCIFQGAERMSSFYSPLTTRRGAGSNNSSRIQSTGTGACYLLQNQRLKRIQSLPNPHRLARSSLKKVRLNFQARLAP